MAFAWVGSKSKVSASLPAPAASCKTLAEMKEQKND